MTDRTILINRAPVLALWAAVVAEKLGYDHETALTLGKAVTGLTAQAKGRHLGIYTSPEKKHGTPTRKSGLGEDRWVELCGRAVPVKETPSGLRAVVKDRPIEPASVERYLEQKFGEDLLEARKAMEFLAARITPGELAEGAFALYERFRPEIPGGQSGWGAKGALDLGRIRSLARKSARP